MLEEPVPFEEAVKFHGHRCPGLALGYRAAGIAMEELHATRSGDEDLLAIVENDACGVDAIQYVTGCTIGKGNLIFRDFGKQVYTFINRSTGDAVRISQRTEFAQRRRAQGSQDLRAKVVAGTATPDEEAEFRRQSNRTVEEIMAMPRRGDLQRGARAGRGAGKGKDIPVPPVCGLRGDGLGIKVPGQGRENRVHSLCGRVYPGMVLNNALH